MLNKTLNRTARNFLIKVWSRQVHMVPKSEISDPNKRVPGKDPFRVGFGLGPAL